MDDYLTKPINIEDFYATVEKWAKLRKEVIVGNGDNSYKENLGVHEG